MRSELNNLVPFDNLHWDSESNSNQILSPSDLDNVIKACMNAGLEDSKDILKVVREYENTRCGELMFDQFFAGRISICAVSEEGSPIFESRRDS